MKNVKLLFPLLFILPFTLSALTANRPFIPKKMQPGDYLEVHSSGKGSNLRIVNYTADNKIVSQHTVYCNKNNKKRDHLGQWRLVKTPDMAIEICLASSKIADSPAQLKNLIANRLNQALPKTSELVKRKVPKNFGPSDFIVVRNVSKEATSQYDNQDLYLNTILKQKLLAWTSLNSSLTINPREVSRWFSNVGLSIAAVDFGASYSSDCLSKNIQLIFSPGFSVLDQCS